MTIEVEIVEYLGFNTIKYEETIAELLAQGYKLISSVGATWGEGQERGMGAIYLFARNYND